MYEFQVETLIGEGKVTREVIDEITHWLRHDQDDHYLPDVPEQFLAVFLMACDSDIEKTKKTIKAYFKLKRKSPDLFDNRDIDERKELKQALDVINIASLPERTPENYAVHFFKLTDTNYANVDLVLMNKVGMMLVDITLNKNPPDGIISIIDMAGVGFMHLTLFRYGPCKAFLTYLQEAFPLKLKKVYILNANFIFDKALGLLKTFMKAELVEMIQPFPPDLDMAEFHKNHIPAKCLPMEYGGSLPSCGELHQRTVQQFREMKQFFKAEQEMREKYKPRK